MTLLHTLRPHYSQPQRAPAGIDRSNPLCAGLVDVFAPLGPHNATAIRRFLPFALAGGVEAGVGALGRNITLPTVTIGRSLVIANSGNDLTPSATDATFFVIRRPLDTVARATTLFGCEAGASARILVHAPWSDGNLYFDFGNSTAGSGSVSAPFVKSTSPDYLVFVAGGGKGREVWRNGTRIASNTAATASRPAGLPNFRLGACNNSNVSSDLEEIYLFGAAGRAWSDREIGSWFANPWQVFEPRRVWVPGSAVGGPTIVSTTAPLSWSVRNAVQATRAASWSVRGLVQATAPTAWSVRNLVGTTRDAAWSIQGLGLVSTTRDLSWSVRALVPTTRGAAWSVRGLVGATAAAAWSVRGLTVTTRDLSWSVQAAGLVSTTRTLGWSVRGLVATTAPASWSVRGLVPATRGLAWSVRALVPTTRGAAWSVRNFAGATRDLAWSVRGVNLVGTTRALSWSVRGWVHTTRGLSWRVGDVTFGYARRMTLHPEPHRMTLHPEPHRMTLHPEPHRMTLHPEPHRMTLQDN